MVEGTSSQSSAPDPEGALPSVSELSVGDELGHYRLLSTHRGGMGEIFVAEDIERPGAYVVIKRLLEDFVEDETYLAMFRDEARIMSQFQHPNIVRVLETPVLHGSMCLVMELVRGRNVMQILERAKALGARIPAAAAVHIMSEALRGLHYAHTALDAKGRPMELVHRDVSPGNLLVSFAGEVKVTDFGIAKSRMSVVATSVGVVKGTTRYLSPEQIRGGEVTPRSDLFACAAVLLEMLTGVAVFERGQVPPTLLAIVKGKRKSVGELLPFVEPGLEMLLEQALSLAPSQRPESAGAMADALDALRPNLGPSASASSVGNYLGHLFPADAADIESRVHFVGAGLPASAPRTTAGARPLDATEFEAKISVDLPRTPLAPVGSSEVDEVPGLSQTSEPASSEPSVSDSVVAADAFDLSDSPPVLVPPFSMKTFLFGAAVGAAIMYGIMFLQPKPTPSPGSIGPLPTVRKSPAYVPPASTRFRPAEPPAATASTATTTGSESEVAAEPGYLTVKRPRRGWVYVFVGDKRIRRRRIPVRRVEVPSGALRVLISTRSKKPRREVEFDLLPGQHLDLTKSTIQIVQESERSP